MHYGFLWVLESEQGSLSSSANRCKKYFASSDPDQASHDPLIHVAGWGSIVLGVAGLVGAVAAGITLVASLPIVATATSIAATVGLVAAVVGGGVTACQNLFGRCK